MSAETKGDGRETHFVSLRESLDEVWIRGAFVLFFRSRTGSAPFAFFYWEVYPYALPFVYPVGMMAQTGSAYMTLGITIERYLVVCWPLKSR